MTNLKDNKLIISNYLDNFLPDAKWYTSDIIQYKGKGKMYYLVFESISTYTKSQSFFDLNKELLTLGKQELFFKDTQVTRIPFFAGCTNQELSFYLGVPLTAKLEIDISYQVLPIDFNVLGLDCYYSYLDQIFNEPLPIMGLNKKGNYCRYWTKFRGREEELSYNLIPKYLLDKDRTQPETKQFLIPYIKELKELLGDEYDNRK